MATPLARSFVLSLFAGALGCSGQALSTSTSGSSLLQGRVALPGSTRIEVAQIESGGALPEIASAAVDASGHYSLRAPVASAGTTQLLITAMSGSGGVLGSVVVENDFAAGSTVKVAPIDDQSSAEANLLTHSRASTQWAVGFTFGELRALVSDRTAAVIGTNVAAPLPDAIVAVSSLSAWNRMLALESVTTSDHAEMLDSLGSAQATLDAQLDAATTDSQRDAASAAYFSAFIKDNLRAGATPEQLAVAASATADVMTLYASSLLAPDRSAVVARAESLRASQVTAFIAGELVTLGAVESSQDEVSSAAATLQSQIAAAAPLGDTADETINAAWKQYAAQANAQLVTALNLNAGQVAAAQTAARLELATLDDARADLVPSSPVGDSADAESQALWQFMTSGSTETALSGIGDDNARAYAEAILLLDAAGGSL